MIQLSHTIVYFYCHSVAIFLFLLQFCSFFAYFYNHFHPFSHLPFSEVQVVDQMPMLPSHEQPRVALVTLLFSEKLAVDAMMDNKTTYVKYKTEGMTMIQMFKICRLSELSLS